MPGVPDPVSGPLGVFWSAIFSAIRANAQQTSALVAGSIAGTLVDRWGNAIECYGPNLAQVLPIGANLSNPASPKAAVYVSTGKAAGTAGRTTQQTLATGTITTTKGSTAATLVSTISGTFTNGQQIGAANVSDPSSGVATPAVAPGTTFTISGSAITLSQVAAESGTGIYAAACTWS